MVMLLGKYGSEYIGVGTVVQVDNLLQVSNLVLTEVVKFVRHGGICIFL